MTTLLQDTWELLKEAPDAMIEAGLLAELVANGPEQTPVQLAAVLQKGVRYGLLANFSVTYLNALLLDLCEGDQAEVLRVLLEAANEVEKEERT